ncbi:PREDICTED: AN1-type zinc finger protein 6-like [Fragaria vesca subsp. vesca]|uniref:AN1-type zinc finger protein 6-like n=1 Tax=Fragaria vesca subsp. vesca TaxID=101020 RepID=UPI0002C2F583|nr:PREDICTED: AN1-type zinc finger protein 6-like [Fragaria vesca subsp. vesca]
MESPSNNNCPRLCARGCGFYGSFATNSMCSKCYRDYQKEEELLAKFIAAPSAVAPVDKTLDVDSVSANKSSSTSTTSDDQPSGVTNKKNCCQNESCGKSDKTCKTSLK